MGDKKRIVVKNKKRFMLIGLGVIVAVAGLLGYRAFSRYQSMKEMSGRIGQVETVRVKKQNLIESISVTGTIASADAWDVSASAKNVEVLQVNYEVGDYVNQGDVIVVLDTTELETGLEQAKNSQTLSEYKESKSIESATENYTEAVEAGTDAYQKAVETEADAKEALREADNDLEDAADRLLSQEERLGQAQKAYNEYLASVEADGITEEEQRQLDALKATWTAAQTEYTSRHQEYVRMKEADDKAVEAYEKAAEALVDAEESNNKNIANAADKLEQAQMEHTYSNDSSQKTIENYQEQIDSCMVVAPISGVITSMNVSVGDTYMGEGKTMFSVADNEHFVVTASVDEYDISSIKKNMDAAVIVEALGEEELPATVSFVSPTVTNSTMGGSSYAIEIALNDVNIDLRIGMTAKASIVLDAAYDVLTVPYDCVNTDRGGNSTVTIDRDGERVEIPVSVGMQGDYYVEISSEELDENTLVYYANPMVINEGSGENDENLMRGGMPNMGGGMMPGSMPNGGGQMPAGGRQGGQMPGGSGR